VGPMGQRQIPTDMSRADRDGEETGDPASEATSAPTIACPFCASSEVEPMSLFGQQLLTVQFYCNQCRTPFEKIRDAAVLGAFRDAR